MLTMLTPLLPRVLSVTSSTTPAAALRWLSFTSVTRTGTRSGRSCSWQPKVRLTCSSSPELL